MRRVAKGYRRNVTVNIASPETSSQTSEAERAWLLIKDTADQTILEAYLKRYAGTFFATLAQARIDEFKKQKTALSSPPPAPASRQWSYGPAAPPENPATRVIGFTYRTLFHRVAEPRDDARRARQMVTEHFAAYPPS